MAVRCPMAFTAYSLLHVYLFVVPEHVPARYSPTTQFGLSQAAHTQHPWAWASLGVRIFSVHTRKLHQRIVGVGAASKLWGVSFGHGARAPWQHSAPFAAHVVQVGVPSSLKYRPVHVCSIPNHGQDPRILDFRRETC